MIKPERGQWLFTCRMEPLQFSHYMPSNPDHYDQTYIQSLTPEELDAFIHDDFATIEGSHHSTHSCSMTLISESYAKWFLENKVWELYDQYKNSKDNDTYENRWMLYERDVKHLCEAHGIKYEGI
jgi:hypothetical protein